MATHFALHLFFLFVCTAALSVSQPSISPEVFPEQTSASSTLNFGPCTREQLHQVEARSDDIDYLCLQSNGQSGQSVGQVESDNSPFTRDCRKLRGRLSERRQNRLLNLGFTIICLIDGSESGIMTNGQSSCTALICRPSREQRSPESPFFNSILFGCCSCRRVCCFPGFERCVCKPRCETSCGRRRRFFQSITSRRTWEVSGYWFLKLSLLMDPSVAALNTSPWLQSWSQWWPDVDSSMNFPET